MVTTGILQDCCYGDAITRDSQLPPLAMLVPAGFERSRVDSYGHLAVWQLCTCISLQAPSLS